MDSANLGLIPTAVEDRFRTTSVLKLDKEGFSTEAKAVRGSFRDRKNLKCVPVPEPAVYANHRKQHLRRDSDREGLPKFEVDRGPDTADILGRQGRASENPRKPFFLYTNFSA
jgi:hypothetical protein